MTDAEALNVALEEIRRLLLWKAEAIVVIEQWEHCYEAVAKRGYPARLGEFKALHTLRTIEERFSARSPNDGSEAI